MDMCNLTLLPFSFITGYKIGSMWIVHQRWFCFIFQMLMSPLVHLDLNSLNQYKGFCCCWWCFLITLKSWYWCSPQTQHNFTKKQLKTPVSCFNTWLFPVFTAYWHCPGFTGETSKPFCGGYNRDTAVQDRGTVRFDLHAETESRWVASSMSSPSKNQREAGGPSNRLPEWTGQRKKESRAITEEIYGFGCQQPSNYYFHGRV